MEPRNASLARSMILLSCKLNSGSTTDERLAIGVERCLLWLPCESRVVFGNDGRTATFVTTLRIQGSVGYLVGDISTGAGNLILPVG